MHIRKRQERHHRALPRSSQREVPSLLSHAVKKRSIMTHNLEIMKLFFNVLAVTLLLLDHGEISIVTISIPSISVPYRPMHQALYGGLGLLG